MLRKGLFKKPSNELEAGGEHGEPAPEAPDRLVVRCSSCKKMIFDEDFRSNQMVCPNCGKHMRLSGRRRILTVADPGSFQETNSDLCSTDFLSFPEYTEKLDAAQRHSGEAEGVVTGLMVVNGCPCMVFAMDHRFMMGSMGSVIGEKITRCFEEAQQNKLPVVGFTVSGGARMQEGLTSLMQMAKTSGAVKRFSDAGGLYICVLTDPTSGGVTASFAMEADILISEPGALIAFAGPRVIEQTIHKKLPAGFQRAEFLQEKGFLDLVVPRKKLRGTLYRLLSLHRREDGGYGRI
ncbi:MAG: acetyl-CoA carboxylase carboxyl transferase subunit beta [Oscillospiraceae bacterium]|nr:acetyl-CoA carboxylase carboxyl transferase subunit beta [Oscillospiraceae bacterium]